MYKYIESRMSLQKKTADPDAEIDDSISHQSRWFSLQAPARVHLCTYYFSTSDLRRFLLQMSMQRRLQWTSGLPQFHRVGPHLKLSQEIWIISKNNIRHTIISKSVLPGWIVGLVTLWSQQWQNFFMDKIFYFHRINLEITLEGHKNTNHWSQIIIIFL